MLTAEGNLERALFISKQEGRQEGRQEEKHKAAERLLRKGYNEEDIADAVELPLSIIFEIKGKLGSVNNSL
jgi:SOS response regulatory protein OraA/RecX